VDITARRRINSNEKSYEHTPLLRLHLSRHFAHVLARMAPINFLPVNDYGNLTDKNKENVVVRIILLNERSARRMLLERDEFGEVYS